LVFNAAFIISNYFDDLVKKLIYFDDLFVFFLLVCIRAIEIFRTMALSGDHKNRGELRIYESVDEVKTVLAEYIAELSDAAVQDHGFFSLVISGGSLIDLMGYLYFNLLLIMFL
jgi:hypothetical protein